MSAARLTNQHTEQIIAIIGYGGWVGWGIFDHFKRVLLNSRKEWLAKIYINCRIDHVANDVLPWPLMLNAENNTVVLPSSVNGQQNGKVIPSLEGNRDRGFECRYYLERGSWVQFLLNLCRPPVRSLLPALQMFVLSQVRQISFNSLYILISAAYSCQCLQ